MTPFTCAVGTTHCAEPLVGRVNCVGPLYARSALLLPGCVMVLVGHCTRKDWALAPTVVSQTTKIGNHTWYSFLMTEQPPSPHVGAHSASCLRFSGLKSGRELQHKRIVWLDPDSADLSLRASLCFTHDELNPGR